MRNKLKTLKYFLLASSAFSVLSSQPALGANAYEQMRVARDVLRVQRVFGGFGDFEDLDLEFKNIIIQEIARGTNLPVNTVI